ncbi:MAG: alpha/beta hydrolase [Acidobacteriota bacterium]
MFGYEMVLVHGAFEGPWVFRSFAAAFASEGWAVRSVTLPGHEPGGDLRGLGLSQMAAAVEAALLEPERTVLVGHSLGGWLALRVLEGLQVAASVLLMPLPRRGLSREARRRVWRAASLRARLAFLFGETVSLEGEERLLDLAFGPGGEARKRFLREGGTEGGRLLRQIARLGLAGPLGRLSDRRLQRRQRGRPHLVVASSGDLLTPAGDLEETARLLGATLLVLEGLPHNALATEASALLAARTARWLEGSLPGPKS